MKTIYLAFSALCMYSFVSAQVGIGTTNPSAASNLEVSGSTNGVAPYRGFMPPRVDTPAERDLIATTSTDAGLMIFVRSTGCLQLWDGDSWEDLDCYTVPPVPTQPWINEIHYENTGPDVSEGVEIAGPAGLDLSIYQVILYNGSGGASYANIGLSGVIDDEGSGYGALWFPEADIQNGSPDGMALYNTVTNTVVQFLSYEGDFTATNSVANGSTSVDIGESEPGSTPIGQSLQLTGSGNRYSDFSWNPPAASSEGSLNIGQIIM